MSTIVLSGKHTDTAAFKRQAGLPTTVRHIVNCDSLPPFARTVHVLPSYYGRRDVHAVEARLRRLDRKVPGGLKRLEWGLDSESRVFFQHNDEDQPPLPFDEDGDGEAQSPEEELVEALAAEGATEEELEVAVKDFLEDEIILPGAELPGEKPTDIEALVEPKPAPRTRKKKAEAKEAAVAAGVLPTDTDTSEEPWLTREQVAEETGAEDDDLLALLGELD